MVDISHTKIIPYQSEWSEEFKSEVKILQNVFGNKALNFEHIGSTSVPGLLSKPIIDIAVIIENQENAGSFTVPVALVGYKFHSSSTERHFYTKGKPIEYHLSIAYADLGGFLSRQILFRDYLRSHPEARDEYAAIKKNLLKNDPTGVGSYLEGKSEFVQKILNLAGWKEGQMYKK